MSQFVKVAKKSEIPEDTGKKIEIQGQEIALFKKDGKICAIHSVCPHQGGPLEEGGVHEGKVMCPWHGWEFDIVTGECSFNDSIKVPTFKVKEEGDDVYVAV